MFGKMLTFIPNFFVFQNKLKDDKNTVLSGQLHRYLKYPNQLLQPYVHLLWLLFYLLVYFQINLHLMSLQHIWKITFLLSSFNVDWFSSVFYPLILFMLLFLDHKFMILILIDNNHTSSKFHFNQGGLYLNYYGTK